LGEAVAVELYNFGFRIVDEAETAKIAGRESAMEFEVAAGASLSSLSQKGIDALLVVKSVSSYDGTPQSASARITSTATGSTVAAVSWQNGWGGMKGSMADRTMRKDLSEAAREIAKGLRKSLR
jgi:hypothetical protein